MSEVRAACCCVCQSDSVAVGARVGRFTDRFTEGNRRNPGRCAEAAAVAVVAVSAAGEEVAAPAAFEAPLGGGAGRGSRRPACRAGGRQSRSAEQSGRVD